MGAFKTNEYTTGGVQTPRHSTPGPDAHACSLDAANTTTGSNNPNVHNVDPGSHHDKGANGSAK